MDEKQINGMIQTAKSDLGVEFAALRLNRSPKVISYGSAITGLFTNSSDLDFFVHCGQPVTKQKAVALVKELASQMKDRTRAKKLLYRDVVTMCNGRVPVLKFTHIGLGREININFTSHTGVNNSFLVKHLVSLDARVRAMLVLLKTYFKLKLGPNALTTFNLYSLVIFALQNNPEPVLPPLADFLDTAGQRVLVKDRWPVQFLPKPFETKNRQTLIELILHFCSFYAEFDFADRLVSPYMGNRTPVVTRANYGEIEEFTCSEHQFKFDRVMNVQDFFVLCVNLGSDCTSFQDICRMHHEHRSEYEELAAAADDAALGQAFFARK